MNAKPRFFTPCPAPASRAQERGNAMIYVIIVIALFAALSFLMARDSDTGEAGMLSPEKTNILATQLIQTGNQVAQNIERMTFGGMAFAALDFTGPGEASFEDAPLTAKVFHPAGGGVTLPPLSTEAIEQSSTTPSAGWYAGRFNNVEWTPTDRSGNPINDIIITAYQIDRKICARVNELLTGDPAIPTVTQPLPPLLIESPRHHASSNIGFNSAHCTGRPCEGHASLCVANNDGTEWAYFTIIYGRP